MEQVLGVLVEPLVYHWGVVAGPEEELVVHSRFGGVHLHLDVD